MTCRKCAEVMTDRDRACIACGAPVHVAEPFVEIISGATDGVGRSVPSGGFVIGRAADRAELVLPDPAVSRAHAKIVREGELIFLQDLGSSSGSLVDGVKVVDRVRLRHGAVIQIGNTKLVCYLPTVSTPSGVGGRSQGATR